MLFITRPFDHNWVYADDFWKAPMDGGWLLGKPTMIEGWNFFPGRSKRRGWQLAQSPMASDLITHAYGQKPL